MKKWLVLLILLLPAGHAFAISQVYPSSFDSSGNIGTLIFQGVDHTVNNAGYVITNPADVVDAQATLTNDSNDQYTGFSGTNMSSNVSPDTTNGDYTIWYFSPNTNQALCVATPSQCAAYATLYARFHLQAGVWTGQTSNSVITAVTDIQADDFLPFTGVLSTSTSLTLSFTGTVRTEDWVSAMTLDATLISDTSAGVSTIPISTFNTLANTAIIKRVYSFPAFAGYNLQSTTTPPLIASGKYTIAAHFSKPISFFGATSVFGFNFGSQQIGNVLTYSFVAGSTTDVTELIDRANALATALASSTSQGCNVIPFIAQLSLGDCIGALFIPSARTLSLYNGLGANLTSKPPLGYLKATMTAFGGATTSEASTTPLGLSVLAGAFSVLRTGLALILTLLTGIWAFRRLSKFDFHT